MTAGFSGGGGPTGEDGNQIARAPQQDRRNMTMLMAPLKRKL